MSDAEQRANWRRAIRTGDQAIVTPAELSVLLAELEAAERRIERITEDGEWEHMVGQVKAAEKRIKELEADVERLTSVESLEGRLRALVEAGAPIEDAALTLGVMAANSSHRKRIKELEVEVERLTVQPGAMPNLLPAGGPSDFSAEPHYHQHEVSEETVPQERPPRLSDEERERRSGGFSPLDRLGDPLGAAEKRIEELEAAMRRMLSLLSRGQLPKVSEFAPLLDIKAKP